MSNKGNNRHIKRLASSRYSNVTRKTSKYVVKPYPGRFSSDERIALITVLKEKLGVANTSREAGRIIRSGKVEVNGRRVDTDKFPIGLGDSVSFKDTGESYRVTIGRYGTFSLVKKDDDKIGKVFKVVGKYTERKGR
jgi:small subunit ribosomal protein S4e